MRVKKQAIYEVCTYILADKPCKKCPKSREDKNYGTVYPVCRMIAEETIQTVLNAVGDRTPTPRGAAGAKR